MSDYPQDLIELAPYLEIASSLQTGNNNAKALSYWARWYWVKKAADIYLNGGKKQEVSVVRASYPRFTITFRRRWTWSRS